MAIALRRLGPEPWGRRIERARHDAGLQFRHVEDILAPHISKSTLVRLERHDQVPDGRKDRARAALVVSLYGFELDEFDLDAADLPPGVDRRAIHRLLPRKPAGRRPVTDNKSYGGRRRSRRSGPPDDHSYPEESALAAAV